MEQTSSTRTASSSTLFKRLTISSGLSFSLSLKVLSLVIEHDYDFDDVVDDDNHDDDDDGSQVKRPVQ